MWRPLSHRYAADHSQHLTWMATARVRQENMGLFLVFAGMH